MTQRCIALMAATWVLGVSRHLTRVFFAFPSSAADSDYSPETSAERVSWLCSNAGRWPCKRFAGRIMRSMMTTVPPSTSACVKLVGAMQLIF
jgi:hypothetical protein